RRSEPVDRSRSHSAGYLMMTSGSAADLPPRPDSETGEPFPPHGRAWYGRDRAPEDDPDRETRVSRKPDPPAGKGPVLAWHQANARWKVGLFLVSVALIAGGLILIQLINGNSTPFEVLAYWQVWVVVLVGSLLITRRLAFSRVSAGAGCGQWRTGGVGGRGRGAGVDT